MKIKKVIIAIIIFIIVILAFVFGINLYVKQSTKEQIIKNEDYSQLSNIDCILVLGCGIWEDKPSPMLEDRLNEGISLYKNGVASKIIMSGDHGREEYDEVNVMKKYAIDKGVSSEDIFMDHAGFSTYESIYRAKEIFDAKKIVIVTQEYHLYRALYIANELGIEAYGVNSDPRQYVGATYRELREILARDKDFIKCIFKPEPTYLGDIIEVSGNGDVTNDKLQSFTETIEDAVNNGYFVIDTASNKIYNKNVLDNFIKNTRMNAQNRIEDKIRIVNYNIDGAPTIYDLEYKISSEKEGYILTIDTRRTNYVDSNINNNYSIVVVDDDIPGNYYGIILTEHTDINAVSIDLALYAEINYVSNATKIYKPIEITRYSMDSIIVNK